MEITAQMVKELRDKTGAQMMLCKKALQESDGDLAKAETGLRKMGIESAGSRDDKDADAGIVYTYNHDYRVAVMLRLNCETDFVAKNEEFVELARLIAMHIAWANPDAISMDDLDQDIYKTELEIAKSQIPPEKEEFADKILEGKMSKVLERLCLLHQKEVQVYDGKETIGDLIKLLAKKVGEKIEIGEFVRMAI